MVFDIIDVSCQKSYWRKFRNEVIVSTVDAREYIFAR